MINGFFIDADVKFLTVNWPIFKPEIHLALSPESMIFGNVNAKPKRRKISQPTPLGLKKYRLF
jgi:hypothetical protein